MMMMMMMMMMIVSDIGSNYYTTTEASIQTHGRNEFDIVVCDDDIDCLVSAFGCKSSKTVFHSQRADSINASTSKR